MISPERERSEYRLVLSILGILFPQLLWILKTVDKEIIKNISNKRGGRRVNDSNV